VASARKLVDGIVLRAKEEEKAAGAPGSVTDFFGISLARGLG